MRGRPLWVFLTLLSATAWAEPKSIPPTEWVARATPSYADKESIEGFSLDSREVPVRLERKNGETFLWARVRGEFTRPGWNLLYQSKWLVRAGGDRNFETEVRIIDQTTTATFGGFDADGRFLEQKVDIEFPSWENFHAQIAEERRVIAEEQARQEAEVLERAARAEAAKKESEQFQESLAKRVSKMKRFIFTPSLGYSVISWDESYQSNMTLMALSPQISLQSVLLPPWLSLQLDGHVTAIPLFNSRAGVSAFFWGLDLTAGFAIPLGRTGLRLNLLVGGYYKSMIVNPPVLGFQNLVGPELFPILDYTFKRGHSVSVFSKWSPTLGAEAGTFLNPLTNREIVFGAGYTHALANGSQVPIQVEFSLIDLYLSSKYLTGRTIQVAAGYTF